MQAAAQDVDQHVDQDVDQLRQEHRVLLRAYGEVQARCSALIGRQAGEIARLEALVDAQAMRLRAQAVMRLSALAWAREDRAELERSIPGLGRRVDLGRRVATLQERVRDLMDELQRRDVAAERAAALATAATDYASLEADLAAADVVICQTGCISHGAYWRVQDHCKRTGKACVLVEDPAALRIMRIHEVEEGAGVVPDVVHDSVSEVVPGVISGRGR